MGAHCGSREGDVLARHGNVTTRPEGRGWHGGCDRCQVGGIGHESGGRFAFRQDERNSLVLTGANQLQHVVAGNAEGETCAIGAQGRGNAVGDLATNGGLRLWNGDRQRVVSGNSVSVRVVLGGRRIINNTTEQIYNHDTTPWLFTK